MTVLTPEAPATERRAPAAIPRHLAPMLALLSEMPMLTGAYGFEYKWDGVRALAYFDGETLNLESRNLLDITGQYPELQALREVLPAPAVLDGEIVALDERGRVSFSALQRRMHVTDRSLVRRRVSETPIVYMIFDLLHYDGRSISDLIYPQRRTALESLGLAGSHWQTPPWYRSGPAQLLEAARAVELEGIVAKRLDSRYEPGRRTGAWRKVKLVSRQEFVIGGWLAHLQTRRDMVGSLLVGYYDEPSARSDLLHYAGSVGTGYSDRRRRDLATLLAKYASDLSPFAEDPEKPGAFFVRPELVAEIEFRGWSPEGKLRQPAYKGLRSDKEPGEVVREDRAR